MSVWKQIGCSKLCLSLTYKHAHFRARSAVVKLCPVVLSLGTCMASIFLYERSFSPQWAVILTQNSTSEHFLLNAEILAMG